MAQLWLPVYFGLAIYAAASGVLVLATGTDPTWPWWSALLPLAISHWAAGFLTTWHPTRVHPGPLVCTAISGAATALAIVVAVWAAHGTALWMPRHVAMTILIAASLAGLVGLALATRRWLLCPRD